METSGIEFYEALRAYIPEEAARLIAERSPQPRDLATRADVQAAVAELKADIRGWMLAFFVPLWIGVYGTLAAIVISMLSGG